jgi:hypothetical protein
MKYLKFGIAIVMVLVAAMAVRNKVALDKYSKSYHLQIEKNREINHSKEETEKAVINAQTASITHLGKTIELVHMEKIFPKNATEEKTANHPRLMLIFSELSCNVCQDEETRFAVSIASEYGMKYVLAVVHATNRRYVQNYIRLNQINFPVYYSKDELFLKLNGIKNTPMIFVIDDKNQVIAANYPIPGHPQYSEPMHKFCYHYFNKQK